MVENVAFDYGEFYKSRSAKASGLAVAEVEQNVQPKKVVVVKIKRRDSPTSSTLLKDLESHSNPCELEKKEREREVFRYAEVKHNERSLINKYSVDTEAEEAYVVDLLVRDHRAREAWAAEHFDYSNPNRPIYR